MWTKKDLLSTSRPKEIPEKDFQVIVDQFFYMLQQLADNSGSTDQQRAINYVVVNYKPIYMLAIQMFLKEFSLSHIDPIIAPSTGVFRLVDVIFTFTNRKTELQEKYYVRVETTEKYPFIRSNLLPFMVQRKICNYNYARLGTMHGNVLVILIVN